MRNKRELESTRRPVKGTQPIADWRSKCKGMVVERRGFEPPTSRVRF